MPFQLDLGSATEGAQPLDLAQHFGDAVHLDLGGEVRHQCPAPALPMSSFAHGAVTTAIRLRGLTPAQRFVVVARE